MKIDLDIASVSARYNIDPKLIQSVRIAEGNLIKAVSYGIPSIKTEEDAIRVVCRSAIHAMSDFIKSSGLDEKFINFWANRWAPVGVSNDPTNLNVNWPKNVLKSWESKD